MNTKNFSLKQKKVVVLNFFLFKKTFKLALQYVFIVIKIFKTVFLT